MNKILRYGTVALLASAWIAFAPPANAQTGNRPMHPRPMAPQNAAPTALPPGTALARPGAPSAVSRTYSSAPVGKKTATGEQFFIVASLDLQKSQLLLKYPTEVTLLAKATDQATFLDDSGKAMKLSDLRAGDTVWVTLSGSGDSTAVSKVRKGQMTVAELHHSYLDYPEIK